jgi:hypothetical protein
LTVPYNLDSTPDLSDLKYFDFIKTFQKQFDALEPQRTKTKSELSSNRNFFARDYFSLFLFSFINPAITSMNGLCKISHIEKIHRDVCSHSVSPGTFSESQNIFEPEPLKKIVKNLSKKLQPSYGDPRIQRAVKELIATDGTIIKALPRMAWALWQDESNRAGKLHLQYNIIDQSIVDAVLTDANTCERAVLRNHLKSGALYTADRNYGADYSFFQIFLVALCDFVIRIKNNAKMTELESFELTEIDRKAGVVWDGIVQLGDQWDETQSVRLVIVKAWNTTLRIVTNRRDLSAELIGLIYLYRWQIEIFFKWIKCNLGLTHLLAESKQGVEIQIYLALIATLLFHIAVGHRPNKREMELIQLFLMNWATLEELQNGLGKQKMPS